MWTWGWIWKITENALRSHCQLRLGAIVSWALKEIREVSIDIPSAVSLVDLSLDLCWIQSSDVSQNKTLKWSTRLRLQRINYSKFEPLSQIINSWNYMCLFRGTASSCHDVVRWFQVINNFDIIKASSKQYLFTYIVTCTLTSSAKIRSGYFR